jgi:alpha-mannosidase
VWDWQDPTPGRVDYPVLQPVLLASRRSCHGLGNYYLQTGNHSYRFSLFSHDGDARRGSRLGVAANSPLIAVTPTQPDRRKDLPESRSFFEGSAADVVLTTVKKAEDEDGIVIRCCEMDGENARTRITSFTPFDRARRATMIEDPKEPLAVEGGAVELAIGHHAIETVLLTPRKPGGVQTTGGRASAAPKISVRSSR